MKLNKSAYLFAAALVAGTVGMTSCSSEEVIDATEQGVENKVTLALSVADKFGTRSSANEVNLGGKANLQPITNVSIVPMIGQTYLNPVVMGTLTPNDVKNQTITKTASLNSNVNYFKIYGNVPAENLNEAKVFTGFNLTAENIGLKGTVNVYKPHGLYYYGYAGTAENPIQAGESEESCTGLTAGNPISSSKYIKLSGVNYAVGVLATAVFNGDTQTACVYPNDTKTEGELSEAVSSANVSVTGIIINGQKLTLDEDFNPVQNESGDISVYEEASKKDLLSTTDTKLGASNTAAGNIYCVVTETGTTNTPGKAVTGNIEFELAKGKFLQLANGSRIGSSTTATKFYLAFSLEPESNKAVFMKDYSTFFNATVKNWGLASENPIEVTDATIAVTVDLEWQTGIVYDKEI